MSDVSKKYEEAWTERLAAGKDEWYNSSKGFWSQQEDSVNGVLGGFANLDPRDVRESTKFINYLMENISPPIQLGHVCDCGAGIGRVTKHFLLNHFSKVDLVEPVAHLLEKAKSYVNDPRAVRYVQQGLQEFVPEPNRYDVIWNQWVLLFLTDDDLVAYLRRCKAGLRKNGMIVVKENTYPDDKFEFDDEDFSVTRSDAQYLDIFRRAGLRVIAKEQQDWPDRMLPVIAYALR